MELVEPLGLCCGNGDSRLELELELLEELELWLPPEELDDEDDDDGDDEGDDDGVDGEEDGVDEGEGSDGGCGIDVDMLVWQPASARASAAGSKLRVRLWSLTVVSFPIVSDTLRAPTASGEPVPTSWIAKTGAGFNATPPRRQNCHLRRDHHPPGTIATGLPTCCTPSSAPA